MLERGKNEHGVIEMVDTESLVPAEHLFWQVDAAVDLRGCMKLRSRCTARMKGGGVSIRQCCSNWCCSNTWTGTYRCGGRSAEHRRMQRTDGSCDTR